MILITVDGLNHLYAQKYYNNIFPKQSIKMIKNNVRMFAPAGPTGLGLACLWSGEKIKNFDRNLFMNMTEEDNHPKKFIKKDGKPMDLIWHHFKNTKYYEKSVGPSPYDDNREYWKQYDKLKELGVKFCPCEELSIFSEIAKQDYDFFHIHSAIIKFGTFSCGPYEQGRNPGLLTYDEIRHNKALKKKVYEFGIRRYVEVIKYLQQLTKPDELFVISSDHGTMVDLPFTPNQIDDIPIIINRKVNLSDIKYQWNVKRLLLRLKDGKT